VSLLAAYSTPQQGDHRRVTTVSRLLLSTVEDAKRELTSIYEQNDRDRASAAFLFGTELSSHTQGDARAEALLHHVEARIVERERRAPTLVSEIDLLTRLYADLATAEGGEVLSNDGGCVPGS